MRRALPILIALSLAPRLAGAQAAHLKPEAQTHLDAALKAYDAKDYATAIPELERAYEIDPNPNLLYATAQAYRFSNKCTQAIDLYRRYVASKPNEAQVAAATTGISLCEAALKQQPPVVEPPSSEPASVVTVPMPRDTPWYKDRVGDALTAGGAVAIGVGITFLVMANSSERASKTDQFRGDFLQHLDETTQRRRIGAVAITAGAALAAGGILVYVLRDHAAHPIVGGIDGQSVYLAGSF